MPAHEPKATLCRETLRAPEDATRHAVRTMDDPEACDAMMQTVSAAVDGGGWMSVHACVSDILSESRRWK